MADERPGAVVVGTGFGILTHVRALRAAEKPFARDAPDAAADPAPATFADGVAGMQVLDAIRRSSAERACVPIG